MEDFFWDFSHKNEKKTRRQNPQKKSGGSKIQIREKPTLLQRFDPVSGGNEGTEMDLRSR